MEEEHLVNTIKMIQRSLEPYNKEWERRHPKFKLRDLFKKPKKTAEEDFLHEISMLEEEF